MPLYAQVWTNFGKMKHWNDIVKGLSADVVGSKDP